MGKLPMMENMNIAVGVVDPEDPGYALDPSIATLNVYKRSWNYEKPADTELNFMKAQDAVDCDPIMFWPIVSEDKQAEEDNSAALRCY